MLLVMTFFSSDENEKSWFLAYYVFVTQCENDGILLSLDVKLALSTKCVVFTEIFWPKSDQSKFPQFPHCGIRKSI